MASYTPREFVGKLAELREAGGRVPATTIGEASQAVKTSILAISPRRLRGVGKRGAALGVRYQIQDHGDSADSWIHGSGPWQLIERDTKAGMRVARPRHLFVVPNASEGDGRGPRGVRQWIDHPGTRGKHLFEKGSHAALPAVERVFQTGTFAAIRRVF